MKKIQVSVMLALIVVVLSGVFGHVSFAAPVEPHGVISLTFDDGYQSQYDNAFPLMQARGIPGTFYVFTDSIRDYSTTDDFFMNVSELQTLQSYGSEIGSHSKTHTAFTSLSDSEIREECQISKQALQSLGFSVNNFCYPYGDRNEHIDEIVDEYYRSARTVWNPDYVLPLPHSDFLVDANEGDIGPDLLSSLEWIVDQAYSTNQWAVLYFHQILPNPNGGYAISTQDFESLLDYIVSKGVVPLTINQALELTSPPSSAFATISPTSVRMNVGQSRTFTSSVHGGTPSYSYQWFQNGTAVPGATNSNWTFTPTEVGHYTVYLNVTDSLDNEFGSNIVTDIIVLPESTSSSLLVPDWINVTRDFFDLVPGAVNPVLTAADVTDRDATFVADPFLFQENNVWYMFFEVASADHGEEIGLATSGDGVDWIYQQIVLTEDNHHFAYPYVFKWDNEYYMIPDTYGTDQVILYVATDFPFSWSKVDTLIYGSGLVDSSIFRYDDTWWMFTGTNSECRLFYSDDLLDPGSWIEHPLSPIVSGDSSMARGAGRVTIFDSDRIIRLTQDVSFSVRAFEVDVLTKTSFSEHEVPSSPLVTGSIYEGGSPSDWNGNCMHTIDPWWTGDGWLAAVDGYGNYDSNGWSIGIYVTPSLTVNVNPTGAGLVSANNTGPYHYGDVVTLTPIANPGYTFSGWSGDGVNGVGNTRIVNITRNMAVTASFTQNQYTLTVNHVGNGTVTKIPYQVTYTYGTVVELTASADVGWTFSSWSGGLTGSINPENITIDGNKTVTATFTQDQYTLTTTVNPIEAGSVSADVSGPYHYGDIVTLTPTANLGYTFSGWSGDGEAGAGQTRVVNVTRNMAVTASFTQNHYTLTVNHVGNGTVTKIPYQATYTYGTVVELTADADVGWTFSGWSGGLTGSINPENITIDGNKTVTATFTQNQYALTITVNPLEAGSIFANASGPYHYNDIVVLTPSANPGFTFSGWSGDGVNGEENTRIITITGNVSVTASFTQNQYTLIVNWVGSGSVTQVPNQTISTYGTEITLTAQAAYGWKFNGWIGDLTGETNPATIIMDSNKTVTANFSRTLVYLLLSSSSEMNMVSLGQDVSFSVTVFNDLNPSLNSTLTLTVTGPGNYYHYDFQPIMVAANGVGEYSFEWSVPDVAGTYIVETSLAPAQLTAYDAKWLDMNGVSSTGLEDLGVDSLVNSSLLIGVNGFLVFVVILSLSNVSYLFLQPKIARFLALLRGGRFMW